MISTNALSVFLPHHHLNGLGNENLRLVQEVTRVSEPAAEKFNNVCEDFPNLNILIDSSTSGEIQLRFGHTAVGEKSLGEPIKAFTLAGYLSSPSVISFNIEIAFATDGEKIRLPIAEVLYHATASDLAQSKKHRDWTTHNTVLLPPFRTEAAILHGESDAGELLKIFARSITRWASDADPSSKVDVVTIEVAEAKKPGKAKQASAKMAAAKSKKQSKEKQASSETAAAKMLASITDNCDNVLAFLQAVSVKSPRVLAAPFSLRTDKSAHVWFQRWTELKLPKPPTPSPKDHLGLTDVLTNVTTRLHTAKAFRPVVAAQGEMEKETKGWDRLPTKAQRVILAVSTTAGTSIPTSPPPTIHRFLNARNATALQVDCSLAYAGSNIYLPTSFCQALLQGHILDIPDPDEPTGLLTLLTPPSSAGPANSQQRAMQIQVLLSMGQNRLSKEEVTELLDQRVHVLMSTQELRYLTRNFVKLTGDYLEEGSPVCILMASWPHHIDRFERQYDKAFAMNPILGTDLMDRTHKSVHVFLH